MTDKAIIAKGVGKIAGGFATMLDGVIDIVEGSDGNPVAVAALGVVREAIAGPVDIAAKAIAGKGFDALQAFKEFADILGAVKELADADKAAPAPPKKPRTKP
jgi:hypothetical protein